MCQHPIWGQACLVWKQGMDSGQREYRAEQERARNASERNALCPRPPQPVRVQIRNECMWGEHLSKFLDTRGCPVPCQGYYNPEQISTKAGSLPNIVVDHCDFKQKPAKPILHAALALEYNGAAVEWNRPWLTLRDLFKQWMGKFHGGTLSLQHMREFDLQVNWVRETSDVYVNYMYAWMDHCGDPAEYATSRCKRAAPTRQELADKGFAAAFISHCAPERMRYLRELNAKLVEYSQGRRRITHFGTCERTSSSSSAPRDDNGHSFKRQQLERFKFTISFENSIRADYFSEKHIEAVLANSLPVIWSAPGVEDFLPGGRDSFVFALDFPTPAALARYLLALDVDDDAYLKHFAWRAETEIPNKVFIEQAKYNLLARGPNSYVCRLCQVYMNRFC